MNKKILILLSLLGFVDALYLSLNHILNIETVCSANQSNSCDLVLNSQYSELLFGIPNAFLGVLFYLTLLLIFIFWNKIKIKNIYTSKVLIFITSLASIIYIYFIYLQIFIIESYCLYCLLSAIMTFLIFGILLKSYLKK